MSNASLTRDSKFGAVVSPGGLPVPASVGADGAGNLLRTVDAGDGTSYRGGSFAALAYVSTVRTAANAGDTFTTAAFTALAVDITLTSFVGGAAPSLTFFVDRFGNDGQWYRVWTSAALTAPGPVSVSIGQLPSGTGLVPAVLTATARFGWTVAGTPTSFTFSASVVGRP